jgi:hypothetical protein
MKPIVVPAEDATQISAVVFRNNHESSGAATVVAILMPVVEPETVTVDGPANAVFIALRF